MVLHLSLTLSYLSSFTCQTYLCDWHPRGLYHKRAAPPIAPGLLLATWLEFGPDSSFSLSIDHRTADRSFCSKARECYCVLEDAIHDLFNCELISAEQTYTFLFKFILLLLAWISVNLYFQQCIYHHPRYISPNDWNKRWKDCDLSGRDLINLKEHVLQQNREYSQWIPRFSDDSRRAFQNFIGIDGNTLQICWTVWRDFIICCSKMWAPLMIYTMCHGPVQTFKY